MSLRSIGVLLLLVPQIAQSAPRPIYGGQLEAYVFGPAISLSPQQAPRPADRAALAALFEPLYTLSTTGVLTPVLASGPPQIQGSDLFIPLRTSVKLHDGRVLTPEMVAQALQSKLHTPAAHVLVPIAGFYKATAGQGRLALRADLQRHGVHIELAQPYPGYPRLLASAHAAIAVPSVRTLRQVGTGPFSLKARSARGGVELRPFVQHWRGRPYLDRLVFKMHASRSSAATWARRTKATLLFGVPDARGIDPGVLHWPTASQAPQQLRIIRVGQPALHSIVDQALRRKHLVRKFMDNRAKPARRMLTGLEPLPNETAARAGRSMNLKLIVSQTDRVGWPFAKRVQLDLLRAGISATLERVDGSTLDARLKAPGQDIVIGSLLRDAPETGSPEDKLHGLLSMASALGEAEAIPPEELGVLLAADAQSQPSLLSEIEARLRQRLGIVVIATRPPGLMMQVPLLNWRVDTRGALVVDDARLSERTP